MELIKSGTSDLPMGLFVKIAKRHRVREYLVQLFGHFQAHWLFKFEWQSMVHSSVRLNLSHTLVKARLGVDVIGSFRVSLLFFHGFSLSDS